MSNRRTLALTAATLLACVTASHASAQAEPIGGPPQLLEIHHAARKGDIEALRRELANGVSPNAPNPGGFEWQANATPLIWAARLGTAEAIKVLLEAGARPNLTAADGATPLMLATAGEQASEKIRLLLDAGADPNIIRGDGTTALIWAASFCKEAEAITQLVKAGARLDARTARDGHTPLMVAARVGNVVTARALIKEGAPVEVKSDQGYTALMWAAEGSEGNAETVSALIELGAEIEARSSDGSTPLMICALKGDPKRVKALLDRGADVKARTARGDSALMAAATTGKPMNAKLLLDAGADPNAANRDGVTPLALATLSGDPSTVRLLIAHGADVNAANKDGWSPILLAQGIGIIEPLVNAGANVNVAASVQSDRAGWTPVMFAIADRDSYSLRRLLRAGADLSPKNAAGQSAADIALSLPDDASKPLILETLGIEAPAPATEPALPGPAPQPIGS